MRLAVLVCTLAPVGCADLPAGTSASPTSSPYSIFKAEAQKITPDDPLPLFRKVFPKQGDVITKDALETTAEYKARLAALGVGGTYVFQIPPEQCHVFPYPDDNVYVVGANDCFPTKGGQGEPYGITVVEIDTSYKVKLVTRKGVPYERTFSQGLAYQLWLENYFQLTSYLRWHGDDDDTQACFGLPVQIADPEFRQRLRDKKIGLAVRVKVGDIAKARKEPNVYRQTFEITPKPYTLAYLPVTLLEAWVIDTSTQMSVVHWTASPSDPK